MASRRVCGRRDAPRREKPVVLVVCEGETERRYFKGIRARLRANGIEVCLSDESNPRAILACAKREKKKLVADGLKVDAVWLVFDAETEAVQRERGYTLVIEEALRAGFRVANSSPCFEYWPLLHFVPGIMVVNPADAERELGRTGRIPGYRKPDLPFDDLWKLYQTGAPSKAAVARRKACEALGDDPRFARPVTFVDELVDELVGTFGV